MLPTPAESTLSIGAEDAPETSSSAPSIVTCRIRRPKEEKAPHNTRGKEGSDERHGGRGASDGPEMAPETSSSAPSMVTCRIKRPNGQACGTKDRF